ncbi:MAG: DoxX family membrane protein [bacterium]
MVEADPARHRYADLAFRMLFSLIFVGAGLRHLVRPEEIVGRLESAPLAYLATAIAPAPVLVFVGGLVLLVAGVALLLGIGTRSAAIVLALVLVPITVTVDLGHVGALGPLFKNIALLGGLIHFAAYGNGAGIARS